MSNSIVRYCAQQCERQGVGALSVADMFDAWMLAESQSVSVELIEALGKMVEPRMNVNGFRTCNVSIGGSIKPVIDFRRAITLLLFSLQERSITPNEAYREFEELHPFADGNGRVGAILINKWYHTMHAPALCPEEIDPEFFKACRSVLAVL